MRIFYSLLILLFICSPSYAKRLDEMNANTSPDITNDLIYSQDVSDTSENSHGTGKSLTIKNLLKATKINVDGTNVGINTITPTQQLEVVGTVKATSFMGDGSGLTGVSGSVSDSAYGVGWDGDTTTGASKNALYDKIETLGSASISNAVYGAGWDGDTSTAPSKNAVYDKIETIGSTSGGWTDGGSSIYTTTSTDNVGIGTPNPQFLLDVNGSSRVGGSGNIAFDNSVILNASVDNILGITGGNVGINSTTPESTLDVLGTGRFTSTLRASSLTATGLTSGQCVQTTTGGLLTTTGSACGSGGSVTIGTTSPMTGAGSGSSFTLGVDQSKMTLSSIGGSVTDSQVPNTITIDNATTAANLGADGVNALTEIDQAIKTALNDTSKLVVGTAGATDDCAKWDVNGNLVTAGAACGTASGAPTDADYLVGTANGGLSAEIVVGTSPSGELGGTWGSPTIDDSVTVTGWDLGASVATTPSGGDNDTSVATTAYVQTEISGISGGSGGWTDGGANVYLTATSDTVGVGTTTPNAQLMISNVGTGDSFRVDDALNDTTPFLITSAGNVGIGTSSPSSPFQFGAVSASNFISMSTASAPAMVIRADSASTVDLLNIQSSGISSGNALEVSSSSASQTVPLALFTQSAASSGGTLRVNQTSASSTGRATHITNAGTGDTFLIEDVATDSSPFLIGSDGNVGIGTTNVSTAKLRVIGTVNATAFVGDGSGLTGVSGGGEATTVSDTTTVNLTLTGNDVTADGLYTAGDALTLTGADIDFDGGATPGGELGGTWASPTIDDSVTVTGWALGASTATTPSSGDNDTSLATTAYVQTELSGLGSGGWTDGGTKIYPTLTSDQVAIGTTTPISGASLTVLGTLAGAGTGPIAFTNANVGIGTTTAPALLTVGSTGSFQIDTSGNTRVGIGTTTAGTIICVKSISSGTAVLGYCTGSLTNSICGTCN